MAKSKKGSKKHIIIIVMIILIVGAIVGGYGYYLAKTQENPAEILKLYIANINEEKYEEMYEMLDNQSKQNITKEDFIARN